MKFQKVENGETTIITVNKNSMIVNRKVYSNEDACLISNQNMDYSHYNNYNSTKDILSELKRKQYNQI